MNQIDKTFQQLKRNKKKAFIAFITAGDPNLKMTEELVLSFEQAGVDIIELGVPFSDPLADGPTIQASSARALKKGVNIQKIFDTVRSIRKKSSIPICLMGYYNPIFHYGEKQFCKDAAASGVDGLIIPDLPPEEARDLIKLSKDNDLSQVFFLAPTTTPKRVKKIVQHSTGFIYFVSLTGVTGARQDIPPSVVKQMQLAKKQTAKPICVGFGISNAQQVQSMAKVADGVIVGSAIVNEIYKNRSSKKLVSEVSQFVKKLSKPLK